MFTLRILEKGYRIRGLRRPMNAARKDSFAQTADFFHRRFTAARFTESHAAKAGYANRKGQRLSRTSKAFRNSYYGRKLRSQFGGGVGLALPLVWSGKSRERAKTPRLTATFRGAKLRFNAPSLNFRHPKSRVNMRAEFTRVLPEEKRQTHAELRRMLAKNIRRNRGAT